MTCPIRGFPGRAVIRWVLLASLLAATGCAPPATLERWQQTLERYVENETNGDLAAALHARKSPSGHYAFTVLGDQHPEFAHDVTGLLVEPLEVADRRWFVLLLGRVAPPRIEWIRPAAVRQEDGRLHWAIGEPGPDALQTYRRFWQRDTNGDGDAAPPAGILADWPRIGDRYTAAVDADAVTIREQRSAATWRLPLSKLRP